MLTSSVENMLVTNIDTKLEIGVVPTQYIVIISTVPRQSEVGTQRWINVGPIVNFCLGSFIFWIIPNRIFYPIHMDHIESSIRNFQKSDLESDSTNSKTIY